LRQTLAKRYTCQKKRKSSSNEPKLKSKRPKISNNADENYGHADPLDNLKDVNDEQFINEINAFVRFLYYCCQYKYTYIYIFIVYYSTSIIFNIFRKLGKVDRVHIEKETRLVVSYGSGKDYRG